MSTRPEKFYLTTPIYYVNARPHIGHAYTTIVADVVARHHRLLGHDTFFLTGTDEHGQKIERSAAAAGIPPQQFADEVSESFRALWKRMGLTVDDYIRTTDANHKQGVQKLFRTLYDRGAIYLSSYTGQYSVGEEMFVEGPPGTLGPDGRPTETVTEENYFFRLSDFQLPLLNLIESSTLRVEPEARRNEVLSFLRGNLVETAGMGTGLRGDAGILEQGLSLGEISEGLTNRKLARSNAGLLYVPGALKDLSVSRSSFTWGIPVPDLGPDADKPAGNHIIYVWLDALANYMTAVGYGSDDPAEQARFEHYWPADLHIIGKEISRFHCVYWPAFLLAAGLPLPKAITAHGWLLFEESKMSKSRGNIVRTETILDGFGDHYRRELVRLGQPEPTSHEADLFASDVLRYFLLREIPFGQDGGFSFDAMLTRYNADLVNGYGNLVSRTLTLIQTAFSSQVPRPENLHYAGVPEMLKGELPEYVQGLAASVGDRYETAGFTAAAFLPMAVVTTTDKYFSDRAPWKLAKSSEPHDREKLASVLYTAAESIRILTALLYPVLPYATARVWAQLGLGGIEEAAARGDLKDLQWGGLQPGTPLGPLAPIFPRADKGLAQIMTDMEKPAPSLTAVTDEADAATSTETEFREGSLASVTAPATDHPAHQEIASEAASTDPGAPPRTSALPSANPGAHVGASSAPGPELPKSPSSDLAEPSGVFASAAASASVNATPSSSSPQITIDDFAKVELRVAQVVIAERIPKADKLLRLEVDLGPELGRRQILSGIAEWYTPEDLHGRRIVVITNLAPRKMRGLESHGMLLAASEGDGGKPVLATFSEHIALGSRLK